MIFFVICLVLSFLLFIKAVQKGTIKCNFMGTALGDSWISPLGMFKNP